MSFTTNGIIYKLIELLGVTIETSTGQYIAFVVGGTIFAICIVSFMLLLFRLLVFIQRDNIITALYVR